MREKILSQALRILSMHHALLITGEQKEKRKEIAFDIIDALFCVNQKEGKLCEKCDYCLNKHIERGLALIELLSDSEQREIGIEAVRRIEGQTLLLSDRPNRVVFIAETDRLTKEAVTALLKKIEEPGVRLKYILLAANISFVSPMLRSRVAIYKLPINRQHDLEESNLGDNLATAFTRIDTEYKNKEWALDEVEKLIRHAESRLANMALGDAHEGLDKLSTCLKAASQAHTDLSRTNTNVRLLLETAAINCFKE